MNIPVLLFHKPVLVNFCRTSVIIYPLILLTWRPYALGKLRRSVNNQKYILQSELRLLKGRSTPHKFTEILEIGECQLGTS